MLEGLRSSPRKLAQVFRKGRDAWKKRAQQQQRRAKQLDGKVHDLTRSRDRWKAKAKELKRQLRELEATATPAGLKANGAPAGTGDPVLVRVAENHGGLAAAPPFYLLPNDRASPSI